MNGPFQSLAQAINNALQTFLKDIKYQPFSGKTLILLSILAWLLSLLISTEALQDLLAMLGWFLLIPGIGWELNDWKIKVLELTLFPGPWVTGALASAFLYEVWNITGAVAISIWPLVSALVALFPKFFKYGLSVVNPLYPDAKKLAADRQSLINTLLVSSILSCWFQFHFLTQQWLRDYPSLLTNDFSRSAFVIRFGEGNPRPTSRGVLFLEVIEPMLERELEALSWGQVEQWLLRVEDNVSRLVERAREQIPSTIEDDDWRFEVILRSANPGYRLALRALSPGPSARPEGDVAEKTCLITEIFNVNPSGVPGGNGSLSATQVECEPASDTILEGTGNASL